MGIRAYLKIFQKQCLGVNMNSGTKHPIGAGCVHVNTKYFLISCNVIFLNFLVCTLLVNAKVTTKQCYEIYLVTNQ